MSAGSNAKVIVITGPTATGKTALGVALAKVIEGEIVSADSMQVYRYMNIGTAKPTADEMDNIPHHMIDFVSPEENYSVARYVRDAAKCIDDIVERGKTPILVGGSGQYIESLLVGRTFSSRGDDKLRKELEDEYDRVGGDAMLIKLNKFDPDAAERLFPNDRKRIVRAIETFITTGKTISQHDMETKAIPPRYNSIKFALTYADRADLYAGIDRRVDNMMSQGLKKEVEDLLQSGISQNHTSLQAIGYKELSAAIVGMSDIDNAVEKIKMESRRYAKRQLTWLRRDNDVNWITWNDVPNIDRGIRKILTIERTCR